MAGERRAHTIVVTGLRAHDERLECPRPDKVAYATKLQAKAALRRSHGRKSTLNAYRCVCTCWHLGNRLGGRSSSDSRPGFQPTETDATDRPERSNP